MLLDHDHRGSAARKGLEPERSAARKEIEARQACEVAAEPVENGLAHPVGRRPQSSDIGELDDAAAPDTADDSKCVGSSPAHWRWRSLTNRFEAGGKHCDGC